MSFQDLEAGSRFQAPNRFTGGRQQRPLTSGDSNRELRAGIFRINTAVEYSFSRLVNSIGTPKDTPVLREKLEKARSQILELVKNTSAKLEKAREADLHGAASKINKIAVDQMEKDFQSVLKVFEKAEARRIAAEREINYTHVVPKEIPTSFTAEELDSESLRISQQQTLLLQSRRQEVLLLDNEIAFNEAIIEERDQGMREAEEQIGDVDEMFKIVAVLSNDHRIDIDDISSHIVNSQSATTQATAELRKAAKTQRSTSSFTCLLILIFGIVLLIVIIVVLV